METLNVCGRRESLDHPIPDYPALPSPITIGNTANVYDRRHYELWADHGDLCYLGLNQIIALAR